MSKFTNFRNYDFSGKRVRFCGRPMTKHELSYRISLIDPFDAYALYPDDFCYLDCASRLRELLS